MALDVITKAKASEPYNNGTCIVGISANSGIQSQYELAPYFNQRPNETYLYVHYSGRFDDPVYYG